MRHHSSTVFMITEKKNIKILHTGDTESHKDCCEDALNLDPGALINKRPGK